MNIREKKMRWILFWIFVPLFVITAGLTILSLFSSVIQIDPQFKGIIVGLFVMEAGGAVLALFYSLYTIKPKLVPTNTIPGVSIVREEDSPLGITIDLSKPVTISMQDASIGYTNARNTLSGEYLSSADFKQHFEKMEEHWSFN